MFVGSDASDELEPFKDKNVFCKYTGDVVFPGIFAIETSLKGIVAEGNVFIQRKMAKADSGLEIMRFAPVEFILGIGIKVVLAGQIAGYPEPTFLIVMKSGCRKGDAPTLVNPEPALA